VTCGVAKRSRMRHCQGLIKEENKAEIEKVCPGDRRQIQACDMGRCGSMIETSYAGDDPMKQLKETYKNRMLKAEGKEEDQVETQEYQERSKGKKTRKMKHRGAFDHQIFSDG